MITNEKIEELEYRLENDIEDISDEELEEMFVMVDKEARQESVSLFYDYNIKDCELVSSLNDKRHYIELIMTMAYMAKVNFEDAFGSVKIWDIFIFNELKKSDMLTSPRKKSFKESFPGGYVKEPDPGMREWLLVADITSSYPNQIISFNISPETLVEESELPEELYDLKHKLEQIDGYVDVEKSEEHRELLEKYGVSMTANGEYFSKKKYGIFPTMIASVFNQRRVLKKEAQKLWTEIQEMKNELRKMEDG